MLYNTFVFVDLFVGQICSIYFHLHLYHSSTFVNDCTTYFSVISLLYIYPGLSCLYQYDMVKAMTGTTSRQRGHPTETRMKFFGQKSSDGK
jgi:hypothetical protein